MVAGIAPILIALASFFLRLFNLGDIKTFIFDEVYYVDGARDLLKFGVEVSGNSPEFIVHPPIGKWLIAGGIQIFGDNAFGWRFATALAGSLMILLIALIAHRLFRNSLLTALASALMAVDGLALVHSRTALLDNFLALFILAATYLFLRRQYWWTAIALGLALGTKWSAVYFIAIFGMIALYRAFTHHSGRALIRPTLERVWQFALLPALIYCTSWIGWFISDRGWARDYSSNIVSSFIHYHQQILGFHTSLTEKHTYEANPWSWLIMGRPTSFFYESPKGCGVESCSQEILAIGTPILWWAATLALLVTIGFWVSKRDKQAEILLVVIGASYLPWFAIQERTMFSFYAIAFEPFFLLTLVYLLSKVVRNQRKIAIAFTAIVLVNFFYFLPIFLGIPITYNSWADRMWLPSWI